MTLDSEEELNRIRERHERRNTTCAYKQLNFYPKCDTCLATEDIDMCYISRTDLKKHLEAFNAYRLEKEIGGLL